MTLLEYQQNLYPKKSKFFNKIPFGVGRHIPAQELVVGEISAG